MSHKSTWLVDLCEGSESPQIEGVITIYLDSTLWNPTKISRGLRFSVFLLG